MLVIFFMSSYFTVIFPIDVSVLLLLDHFENSNYINHFKDLAC